MAYQYGMGYQTPQQYYQPQPTMDNLGQLRAAQYQPLPQPVMQQGLGQAMIWVSGQQEAMSYLVAPNSAVALWDSNTPVIYLKQADASGKPTMQIFDLVERVSAPQVAPAPVVQYATIDQLEALASRVDALSARGQRQKKIELKEDGVNE